MTKQQLIKTLKKHSKAIGKERDALRDLREEIDNLFRDCDDGLSLLEDAIDIFSQQN
jgi:hypothetical protein